MSRNNEVLYLGNSVGEWVLYNRPNGKSVEHLPAIITGTSGQPNGPLHLTVFYPVQDANNKPNGDYPSGTFALSNVQYGVDTPNCWQYPER